jgi:hypothetical protein
MSPRGQRGRGASGPPPPHAQVSRAARLCRLPSTDCDDDDDNGRRERTLRVPVRSRSSDGPAGRSTSQGAAVGWQICQQLICIFIHQANRIRAVFQPRRPRTSEQLTFSTIPTPPQLLRRRRRCRAVANEGRPFWPPASVALGLLTESQSQHCSWLASVCGVFVFQSSPEMPAGIPKRPIRVGCRPAGPASDERTAAAPANSARPANSWPALIC